MDYFFGCAKLDGVCRYALAGASKRQVVSHGPLFGTCAVSDCQTPMRPLSAPPRLIRQSHNVALQAQLVRGHATALGPHHRGTSDAGVGGGDIRNIVRRYSKQEISDVYHSPLLLLVFRAATVHAANHDPTKIQLCTLMNIKSKCSYYNTI